jgi:hypothetical protein
LSAGKDASLLVALTLAWLKSEGAEVSLGLGQTIWSEADKGPPFANASDRPAEFLRIDLKQ